MEKKNWYKTAEEAKLAEKLIGMEKDALELWFNGDSTGYRDLWSKRSLTYFDAVCENRIDKYEVLAKQVREKIDGKLKANSYEVRNERVQIGKDMAVLTYQLYAKTNLVNIDYNCIEVFQQEENGWHVIHSTWSTIRPMDVDFSVFKAVV